MSDRQQIIIPVEFPSLNEVIKVAKQHPMAYRNMKKLWTTTVWAHAKQAQLQPFQGRNQFVFLWVASSKRKDPDNICAVGRKMILDGFVAANLMKDGWSGVAGFVDEFAVDRDRPRVAVVIIPAGESLFDKVKT